MKTTIVLIGGGGHCRSCIDVIEQEEKFQIVGILDKESRLNQKVLNYRVIGTDEDIPLLAKEHIFLITVGQIKSAAKRQLLFDKVKVAGGQMPAIVSPLSYVSKYARVGEGSIVMHHALVNVNARVGINSIINSKALIEHDAVVQNHCHISTGAVLNGGVRVRDGAFVGSQSICQESIEIGMNALVGCGVTIKHNVAANECITRNKL